MLKERDDIGEGLVKSQHIRVAGLFEAAVQAIEQGMRCFMRNDIVREAGEDRAAGQVVARIG